MRTKTLTGVLTCFIMIMLSLSSLTAVRSQGSDYAADEINDLIGGIVSYKLAESGSSNVQEWIDGALTEDAGGAADWYIIALSQQGERDLEKFSAALSEYASTHDKSPATSKMKYALALSAAGSTDAYIEDAIDKNIGEMGIMGWIYGLHLLNNGYNSQNYTADQVVGTLLSLQLPDGGWALWGQTGDIDVTAMTLQALAPHMQSQEVASAAERAVELLSSRQKDDGGYESFGTANPESAAQVITALSALGIDAVNDERFIKNGNNVIDGMLKYRLPDGSFSHEYGGNVSETATVQAYYSLVSYVRMQNGSSPLHVIDNRHPVERSSTPAVTEPEPEPIVTLPAPATPDAQHTVPYREPTTVPLYTHNSSTITTSLKNIKKTSETSKTSISTAGSKITSSSAASSMTTFSGLPLTSESIATSAAETEDTSGTTEIAAGTSSERSDSNNKAKAIIVIVGAAGVLSLVCFATGKRNYKNFIAIGVAAAVGITIVMVTDIKSKDEYYHGEKISKPDAVGTVTMTIRCDTVAGKSDSEYIPEDGIILDVTEFDLSEGETVYDILTEAARTYGIQVENTGSSGGAHGMVYIAGINYLYEFQFGDLSGWVYHVNGITPSRGCGDYILSDGDSIEWLYTCELGHDLDEVYEDETVF